MGIHFRPILFYILSHNIAVLQRDDDDDVNDDDEKSIDRSIVSQKLEKTYCLTHFGGSGCGVGKSRRKQHHDDDGSKSRTSKNCARPRARRRDAIQRLQRPVVPRETSEGRVRVHGRGKRRRRRETIYRRIRGERTEMDGTTREGVRDVREHTEERGR